MVWYKFHTLVMSSSSVNCKLKDRWNARMIFHCFALDIVLMQEIAKAVHHYSQVAEHIQYYVYDRDK